MSEENQARRVSVVIGGRRFTVTTDKDNDHVETLAQVVNDKLQESGVRSGVSGVNEAMLVALAIANDLLEERERFAGLKKKIRSQSQRLLEQMDMDRFRNIA